MPARQQAEAEVEVDEVETPQGQATGAPRVATEQDEGTTRPQDLGFPASQPQHREIEVEAIAEAPPDPQGIVEVRMSRDIDEFTFGNPHVHYTLQAGKRYRLPVDVARYLNGIGAIVFR